MPIYEFVCSKCRKKFERLCRMGEADGTACPSCGAKTSRVFSTFFSGGSSGGSSGSSCAGCTSSNCAACR